MPGFGSVTAHLGEAAYPGQIAALEGGGGFMRVALEGGSALAAGDECELEMHDGARFRVTVIEALGGEDGATPGQQEYRMKLLGRGQAATS